MQEGKEWMLEKRWNWRMSMGNVNNVGMKWLGMEKER